MKYTMLILLIGYVAFFWGIRNLLKRPLADWVSSIAMFIPVFAIFFVRSFNDTVVELANYAFILCGFMLYFSIGSALVFFASLVHKNLNKKFFLVTCSFVTVVVLVCGYINAMNPRVHEIDIESNISSEMKICFVSDIHVGRLNSVDGLKKLSHLINHQNPDLVIFGGDLTDPPAFTKYRSQLIDSVHKIKSKHGIYAVFGNHEGYCGLKQAEKLYDECGLKCLCDEAVSFDDFYLIGRRDAYDPKRGKLHDVLDKISRSKPVIVIDHNPSEVHVSAALHVDLQLSGHTHAGQLWPFNIVNNIIYGVPTGKVFKQSDTVCYISPGFGFWGCPFRIGNTPELVIVNLKKRSNEK